MNLVITAKVRVDARASQDIYRLVTEIHDLVVNNLAHWTYANEPPFVTAQEEKEK